MEDRIYKPGDVLGNYQVLEYLGGGGFSAIYKAHDLKDVRKAGPSALKMSRFDFHTVPRAQRWELNARLEREFQALTLLDHRNIVKGLERGTHDGVSFYAMELLEGPTLGRFMGEQRRTFLELMNVFRQVVQGVAWAHNEGVIHRDLKPSNIIVTPEVGRVVDRDDEDLDPGKESYFGKSRIPVVIDFGISHLLGEAPVTAAGCMVGTAEYIPPSYARAILAGDVDKRPHRAEAAEDVYQLGVILYAILTGRLPTRTPQGRRVELLREIRDEVPPHPRAVNPEAPAALSALAMMCLSKRTTARPGDGEQLRWRLAAAMFDDRFLLDGLAPEYLAEAETPLTASPVVASTAPVLELVRSPVEAGGGEQEEEDSAAEVAPPAAPPATGDGRALAEREEEERQAREEERAAREAVEQARRLGQEQAERHLAELAAREAEAFAAREELARLATHHTEQMYVKDQELRASQQLIEMTMRQAVEAKQRYAEDLARERKLAEMEGQALRRYQRLAMMAAGVAFVVFAALAARQELHTERADERVAETTEVQRRIAEMQGDAAHTNVVLAMASAAARAAQEEGRAAPAAWDVTKAAFTAGSPWGAVLPIIAGGLPMPSVPYAWQLKPPPGSRNGDRCYYKGKPIQGIALQGGCWYVFANTDRAAGEPNAKCPVGYYDPPPRGDVPKKRLDLLDSCFKPFLDSSGPPEAMRPDQAPAQ